MPQTAFADRLHAEKYRAPGETFRESMNRVANALKDDDAHYHVLKEILRAQRFLPAGRVQAGAGAGRHVTLQNCFVSGMIEDSYVDGHGSIMQRALEAAATMRMGGGVGYDFSTLRPSGALIKKLRSHSGGPVQFMEIFDAVCRSTSSAGHRRGAQMGVLRVDHPDVEAFVRAKHRVCGDCGYQHLSGFNVSVGVTDEFMRAVEGSETFKLRFGGETYREVDAAQLWDAIMRSTWDYAEPGVIFLDTINRMNNLWYCETLSTCNPCQEEALPPHGACLLGSFNLVQYLRGSPSGWAFDFARFSADMPIAVRAMDNVVDRSVYPLYEQEKEARAKRRMGLGVTALANAGEALGHPYGSPGFLAWETEVMDCLRDGAYEASALLAAEKGAFPAYSAEEYLEGEFVKTLPERVRALIARHGIRNSHLLSVAPTGTISMAADNVSSGIEPVVAYAVDRRVQMESGPEVVRIEDYGAKFLGVRGKTIDDVTVAEHLAVLEVAALRVDASVSKTINVPESASWDEFKDVYRQAWRRGIKGCATFRMGGKRAGILSPVREDAACRVDGETGRSECE